MGDDVTRIPCSLGTDRPFAVASLSVYGAVAWPDGEALPRVAATINATRPSIALPGEVSTVHTFQAEGSGERENDRRDNSSDISNCRAELPGLNGAASTARSRDIVAGVIECDCGGGAPGAVRTRATGQKIGIGLATRGDDRGMVSGRGSTWYGDRVAVIICYVLTALGQRPSSIYPAVPGEVIGLVTDQPSLIRSQ